MVLDDGRSAPTPADQDTIDQTLRLVAAVSRSLAGRLGSPVAVPYPLDRMRVGPLGRDLARLALVAEGAHREPQERVLAAVAAVLQLLLWPAGADDVGVPRPFWTTELGRLLARAKYRAVGPADRVAIGAAALELGVGRATIYRWLDEGALDSVRDERSGRTFVLRGGVDRHRRVVAA